MKFYVIQISVPLTEFPVNFIETQLCACIYVLFIFYDWLHTTRMGTEIKWPAKPKILTCCLALY